MSYARFDTDSDVYVYLAVDGSFVCCGCHLEAAGASVNFSKTEALLDHLRNHRAAGHRVLEETFARLEECRVENDAFIAGGGA